MNTKNKKTFIIERFFNYFRANASKPENQYRFTRPSYQQNSLRDQAGEFSTIRRVNKLDLYKWNKKARD